MDTQEKMLKMKLFDRVEIDSNTTVLRIPGGWIYTIHSSKYSGGFVAVFVPYTEKTNGAFYPEL